MKSKGSIKGICKDFLKIFKFSLETTYCSSPKYFIIRVILIIISIFLPFLSIYLSGEIINKLSMLANTDNQFIYDFLWLCIFLFCIKGIDRVASTVTSYCEGMHRELVTQFTREKIMEKISGIEMAYFDSSEFYDELNDANSNIRLISQNTFQVMSFFKNTVQLVISFFLVSTYSLWGALLLIIAGIPNVICHINFLNKMYSWRRGNMSQERKLNYVFGLVSQKSFAKEIRLFDLSHFLIQKFKTLFKNWYVEKRDVTYKSTLSLGFAALLPEIVTTILTISIGLSVMNRKMGVDDFVYLSGVIAQLLSGVFLVIRNASELNDSRERVSNYIQLIYSEKKKEKNGYLPIDRDQLIEIEFRNVSFVYPGTVRKVLNKVSFKFTSNQKIALVGMNGCGKSTIIKLLLRFYEPTEGEIYVNSIDIRKFDLYSLRRCFSTLFQDYCNYAFTVKESIEIADLQTKCRDNAVKEVLEKSSAWEFVDRFANKENTFLTRAYDSEGEELSGGQWQKIALARTFYREAPIYILDEPSASLDAYSEHIMFQNFESLYKDRGAILVSHRLSNITHVDLILVLDEGNLIESGTHKMLMEQKGKYSEMFQLQADKYAE